MIRTGRLPDRTLALVVTAALVLLALPVVAPSTPARAQTASAAVISQVYGGGGNAGAPLSHDFVELFNPTDAPLSLAGHSVQYASATGTSWQVTPLGDVTLPPGGYLLVRQAAGANTSLPFPEADVIGSIPMSATAGKVALVSSTTALSGSCPTGGVVDRVGFGSANCFEGSGATPALSNTTAALRDGGGCVDTDDNAADFTVGAPAPRNAATAPAPCDPGPDPEPEPGSLLVVSQVYGGGGTATALYRSDFIEVLNRSTVALDLTGWSVQYAGVASGTWQVTPLSGSLEPGQHLLVRQSQGARGQALPTPDVTGTISMNTTAGKVALVDSITPLTGVCPLDDAVDLVGYGAPTCFEGSGPAPQLAGNTSAIRVDGRCADTDDNAADLTTSTPPDPRNRASAPNDCGILPPDPEPVELECPTSPVGGRDVTTVEGYGATRAVTASVPDAVIASFDLDVAPAPQAGAITLTDVDTGSAEGSATLSLTDDLAPGVYTATVTAGATSGAEASCVLSIEVTPLVPIGAVQGSIADDQTSFTSPLLNQRVAVRGVVTQLTRETNGSRGFFLQNTPDEADGDPNSSDGVFVFNGTFTTLRTEAEGPASGSYTVTVGDEIVLRGTVGQFFGMTQFAGTSSFVWEVTDTGVDVDEALTVTEIDPPDDAEDSLRYFRRNLGMQMQVPADSVVVGGRDVFSGTDAEVWAIRGDHPVAQRDEPYHRRVFRDAHPLDNNPETNFDDGNGYRFVIGSFGLKGTTDDPSAVLAPAKTFDTIENSPRGGVYLSFGKYTVNVAEQLDLDTGGPDPSENAPVQPADRERELQIAAYNVENLYDYRDNPNSGCDFPGNPGCFADGSSITPPFDYVPAGDAEYQDRLGRMAEQIRLDLHSPDVVLIQETEAQDVCTVSDDWTPQTGPELGADRLDCDLTATGADNTRTDGRPDSLLELALVIAEQGGPDYDAAFDLDSGDLRGITTAFLYRTDRVELLEPDADDPVLGSDPRVDYRAPLLGYASDVQNPKALNAVLPEDVASRCTSSGATACDGTNVFSRGPSTGLFRVWRGEIGASTWTDLYLINNHQSAGPQNRVLQRTEQALFNARIAEAILDEDADARVVVGGDLNVFPRPDDPYAPGEPIPGIGVGPSDQLRGLYDSPLTNLYDTMLARYPAATYTFGFQGQAQTLDHLWVSDQLFEELVDVRSAKINVDWPADATGEEPAYGRFGASDHDPEAATFEAVSFLRLRELVDRYVAEARLTGAVRANVELRLDRIEDLLAQGPTGAAAAAGQLTSLARYLEAQARVPTRVPADVARAIAVEADVLAAVLRG
jgi:predicted extracellular nuclease